MAHTTASRRAFIKGTATLAIATPAILKSWSASSATNIVFRDPGGPQSIAFKEAFYDPFNEKMKGSINVTGVAGPHEPVAQIKAMVETKNYGWDGADMSLAGWAAADAAGYLEPLNIESDKFVQQIPSQFRRPTFLGTAAYATVNAFNHQVYKDSQPLNGWVDFWDVSRFPGRRSMHRHPFETLEAALLADGVPPSEIYPIDMDRAFKSLDRIKKHISIWWTGGAQSTQLMTSGEVDQCQCWTTRSGAAIDSGAPFTVVWKHGIVQCEGWVVLKGGPKADAAREFVKFCANPERQAALTHHLSSGPVNPNALKYVEEEKARTYPTWPENLAQLVPIDPSYWAKAEGPALERFNNWLLK